MTKRGGEGRIDIVVALVVMLSVSVFQAVAIRYVQGASDQECRRAWDIATEAQEIARQAVEVSHRYELQLLVVRSRLGADIVEMPPQRVVVERYRGIGGSYETRAQAGDL